MSKNFNIYLSYAWFYGDNDKRIIDLMKSKPYFGFQVYSIPVDDPVNQNPKSPDLDTLIHTHMKPCHVVILMGGAYSQFYDWIQKEIRAAEEEFEKPIPVIVVIPPRPVKLSFYVQEHATLIIKWSPDTLVNTIKKLSL